MRTLPIYASDFWYERLSSDTSVSAHLLIGSLYAEFEYFDRKRLAYSNISENLNFHREGICKGMTRAKSKPTTGKKSTADKPTAKETHWINIYLSDEDVVNMSARELSDTELCGEVLVLLETGGDFFVRTNSTDGSVSATFVRDADDSESARCGLSGYSDNWRDAIRSLLYKYYARLDGVLNLPAQRSARRYR